MLHFWETLGQNSGISCCVIVWATSHLLSKIKCSHCSRHQGVFAQLMLLGIFDSLFHYSQQLFLVVKFLVPEDYSVAIICSSTKLMEQLDKCSGKLPLKIVNGILR